MLPLITKAISDFIVIDNTDTAVFKLDEQIPPNQCVLRSNEIQPVKLVPVHSVFNVISTHSQYFFNVTVSVIRII